jgi:hypothetical protein
VLSVKKLEEDYKKREKIKNQIKKNNILPIERFIKKRREIMNNLPPVSLRNSKQNDPNRMDSSEMR